MTDEQRLEENKKLGSDSLNKTVKVNNFYDIFSC